MKRYTKEKLTEYITALTKEIDRKPKILEVVEYMNRLLNRDEYDSYDDYMEDYIGDNLIKYYLKLFSLYDLIYTTKRKQNITKKDKTVKQPDLSLFSI